MDVRGLRGKGQGGSEKTALGADGLSTDRKLPRSRRESGKSKGRKGRRGGSSSMNLHSIRSEQERMLQHESRSVAVYLVR